MASYAQITVRLAQEMLSVWAFGETRDVHADVLKLTTRVVVKTLFNTDVPPAIEQLGEASSVALDQFTKQWNVWRIFPSAAERTRASEVRSQ